jgi:hypothetical protein
MNPKLIPSIVTVMPPGARHGFVTTNGQLILQRRDATDLVEVGAGLGAITVHPARGTPAGRWTVTVSLEVGGDTAVTPDLDAALRKAAHFAGRLVGFSLAAAPFIASTGFGWDSTVPREADRIVSPLRYEHGTDTVRVVATNACVAAFESELFESAHIFDKDLAGEIAWPFVSRAIAEGISDGDRARGSDFCKRRLAWMAGAYWLRATRAPLVCGVLNLDMTAARGKFASGPAGVS